MLSLRFTLAATVLASLATAQFTVVVPNNTAAVEGNSSNAFPWGRGGTGLRICTIYDSTNFTAQGITYPIIISRARWRPNTSASSLASSYPTGATVSLSTSPLDQSAVAAGLPLANFEGTNLTTCFSGPVSWPAAAATTGPCPFLIDIPFTTNFLYDPTAGDLNIETDIPIQTFTGTALQLDVQTTGSLSSRIYISTGYPTGATAISQNHGVVVELTYVPANGLFAGFVGAPRSGPLNTLVQFTDQSYSSDPGGITSWAWDVDGDAVTDYTTQNPSHNYATEGVYTVSLTVTDASNPSSTLTRTGYITIDAVSASYTASIGPGTLVQFTDTSTGGPTTWAWDFDNNGVVDSNLQNPAFVYPAAGAYTCRLTVTDAISSSSTTQNIGVGIIPVPAFGSTFSSATATRGFWLQAPRRFSIISARVPDETNNGTQNVAIYRLAAAPPVFSASATGGLEFVSVGQPSAAPIPCVVSFDTGEFIGVLGACGTATMLNSYGTPVGPYASSVLGTPCTLTRMLTQFNLFSTGGTTAYSQEPAAAVSRVILGVTACAAIPYGTGTPSGAGPAAPTLKTTALPYVGQTATLEVTQGDTGALGFLVVGIGRTSLPTPFGTVLVDNIGGTSILNGGVPMNPGTVTFNFAVPLNPVLVGAGPFNWQNANLVLATNQISMSNGNEWWLDNP